MTEPLCLIFIGPPGAGKGTQAKNVAGARGLAHVATGDLFRAVDPASEIGVELNSYMSQGHLVPDELVLRMLEAHIDAEVGDRGILFDGFPRTEAQAIALDALLARQGRALTRVLYFAVDDDEVVRRITGRRTCKVCQAPYHVESKPPKTEGVCDLDGGELVARSDDNEEKVRTRLGAYSDNTAPLIDYYRGKGLLVELDGTGDIDAITASVQQAIDG